MGMNKEQFLSSLEQKSRERQKQFFAGIKSKLGRTEAQGAPRHPFKGAPSFWHEYELGLEERVELFMRNWTSVGGHAVRLADMEQAAGFIAEKAKEWGARLIIRQNQPELAALSLEQALPDTDIVVWKQDQERNLREAAAGADIGITMADHAAAYTGSIVTVSSANQGRSVSLLPTVMIALIPVDRLRTRLGEVLAQYDGKPREQFPAGIHFISGPSRSADIENDLTIGVHGPGIVYALIIG